MSNKVRFVDNLKVGAYKVLRDDATLPSGSSAILNSLYADSIESPDVNLTGSFSGSFQGNSIGLFSGSIIAPGSDGQILYNSSSMVAGSSGLYYNSIDNRVGIGTTTPSEALTISGSISASGDLYIDGGIYDNNNSLGTSGQLLSSTGTGIDWVDVTEIGGVDGTGSANYITRWQDGDTITTSSIYETPSGNIGIGLTDPSTTLEVSGSISGSGNLYIGGDQTLVGNLNMPGTRIDNRDASDTTTIPLNKLYIGSELNTNSTSINAYFRNTRTENSSPTYDYGIANVSFFNSEDDGFGLVGIYNQTTQCCTGEISYQIGFFNCTRNRHTSNKCTTTQYGFYNLNNIDSYGGSPMVDNLYNISYTNVLNPNSRVCDATGITAGFQLGGGCVDEASALQVLGCQSGGTINGFCYIQIKPWNSSNCIQGLARTYAIRSEVNEPSIFDGTIQASCFITTGGNSSQFVKGDGTLDSSTYLSSSALIGETGYIARWQDTDTLITSSIYEDTPNQRIGVGTTTPSEALTVSGSISASGDLYGDTLVLNSSIDHTVSQGQFGWNTLDGTFDVGLEDGVALQMGQETHIRAKAQGTINNGDAVMFVGAQGDHILVAAATQAVLNVNPEYFVGIATHNMSNNEFGYITTFGLVREIDTDTPDWDPGTVLWFDSMGSTAGALTGSQPQSPYAQIRVAAVTRRNANEGIILVRPDRLPKLNDLQDVDHTNPAYGDLIAYNSASSTWENTKILSGSYTISNGGLTADSFTGSFTGSITSPGSDGQVLYNNGGTIGAGSNIYYNDVNGRVGIGTTSPNTSLQVDGNMYVGAGSPPVGGLYKFSVASNDLGAVFLTSLATAATNGRVFAVGVTGESFVRTVFYSNGFIGFGSGAATRDTFIGRSSTNTIRIGSQYDGTGDADLIVNRNLGIGTTTPTQALTVEGNISGSGNLNIEGTITGSVFSGSLTVPGSNGQVLYNSGSLLQASSDIYYDEVNGRVGIGTTSPTLPLEISSSLLTGHFRLTNGTEYTNFLQYSNGDLNINPSSNLVGINTNPSYTLDVYAPLIANVVNIESGGTRAYVRLVNSNTTGVTTFGADGDDFKFIADRGNILFETATNGTELERMRITDTGNVGIGTTTPSEKLTISGSISASGDLYLNNTLLSNQQNTDVDTGTETIAIIPTGSYDAAFFDYVIKNGTNLRAGTVYAAHDGTDVEFTETSTQDLGDTTDVTLSVDISSGNLRLLATTTSDNWTIKSLIRAI